MVEACTNIATTRAWHVFYHPNLVHLNSVQQQKSIQEINPFRLRGIFGPSYYVEMPGPAHFDKDLYIIQGDNGFFFYKDLAFKIGSLQLRCKLVICWFLLKSNY